MVIFIESIEMDELEKEILDNKTEIDRLKASPQPYSAQVKSQLNRLEIEKLELQQKKDDLKGKEESRIRESRMSRKDIKVKIKQIDKKYGHDDDKYEAELKKAFPGMERFEVDLGDEEDGDRELARKEKKFVSFEDPSIGDGLGFILIPKTMVEGVREAELSTAARNDLPDSAFVFPKERKYPIPDESHARNALARVSANGTDAEKKAVAKAVRAKFPDIEISEDTGWL